MGRQEARPQFLEVAQQSLQATLYACRWIHGSARLLVTGGKPKGSGLFEVHELSETDLTLCHRKETEYTFRCATFDTAPADQRTLATGNTKGELQLWAVDGSLQEQSSVSGHAGMINSVAGCTSEVEGEWQIATGGADGYVKIWDPRQLESAIASFPLEDTISSEECWSVACGNAYGSAERLVLAGYSNGGLALFDLRAGAVRWRCKGNPRVGIVAAAFDRPDIEMNKFAVACLNSELRVFDGRTFHQTLGYAGHTETVPGDSTLWGCAFLPQHRDICLTHGGDGHIRLFQYRYPDRRKVKDTESGEGKGVAGSFDSLSVHCASEQPVSAFHWNAEKTGLYCCTALDQILRDEGRVTAFNNNFVISTAEVTQLRKKWACYKEKRQPAKEP